MRSEFTVLPAKASVGFIFVEIVMSCQPFVFNNPRVPFGIRRRANTPRPWIGEVRTPMRRR